MKFNSIGKAAHIAAAAPRGARFDPAMTHTQRGCISNGIWLCANCADMIDRDAQRYSVDLLVEWRRQAENRAKSELGKPLPSERELAVFKVKALGENVSSQSIVDLLGTTHQISERELEHIDPRFKVDISVDRRGTRIALNPYEPVDLTLCLPSDIAPLYNEQFANLHKHGHPLEISGPGIRIEGSALFKDVATQPIKLVIDTHFQRKALQRLNWIDPHTGKPMAAEFVGKVVAGTESFTFSGKLFGGLYQCAFHVPLNVSGKQTLSSSGTLTFAPWIGEPICHLPYFDKFYSLCEAIYQGQEIDSNLEVDGRDFIRCNSLTLMSSDELKNVLWFFAYLSKVRDILKAFSADVAFRTSEITREEALSVEEIWRRTCHLKTLRGKQLDELSTTIVPSSEAEAEMLKVSIQSDEPQLIGIEQQLAEVSIMGQRLPNRKLLLLFTSIVFRIDEPVSAIRTGLPLKVFFLPTEECRAQVFVEPADALTGMIRSEDGLRQSD